MDIKYLRDNKLIIFEGIVGSNAYGTNLETSDMDIKGVFVAPIDTILGFGYIDQVNDAKNDIVFYEVKKFLELLRANNPTIMEILNLPKDCIIYKNPIFDQIIENKNKFITKQCRNTYGKYAQSQISKAKGQDKKQNWEKNRVTRKTPLDFCFLHIKEKSFPLSDFLSKSGMDQKYCGLAKVPHSRETYSLFYDYVASGKSPAGTEIIDSTQPLMGFRGIAFEDSNDIRLSSIPVDCPHHYFLGYVSYNKDGYTVHCDDYRSYETWLKNKNEARWVDVQSHGQKIDGKNMMHCRRLLEMSREIAEGKGINVRRPNADYLVSIRKGEVDLQTLINNAETDIREIDELFKLSTLPNIVDSELINEILLNIRKQFYKI